MVYVLDHTATALNEAISHRQYDAEDQVMGLATKRIVDSLVKKEDMPAIYARRALLELVVFLRDYCLPRNRPADSQSFGSDTIQRVMQHFCMVQACFLKQLIETICREYERLKTSSDLFDQNVLYGEDHQPIPYEFQAVADDQLPIH